MSSTPQEFIACLQNAFPGAVETAAHQVKLSRDGVTLRFDYRALPPFRIGLLSLPRIELSIQQTAGDEAAGNALLDAVDRATQRGGG